MLEVLHPKSNSTILLCSRQEPHKGLKMALDIVSPEQIDVGDPLHHGFQAMFPLTSELPPGGLSSNSWLLGRGTPGFLQCLGPIRCV